MKKIIATLLLLTGALSVHADETQKDATQEMVDVGNKKCPVSGQPVNGESSCTHNGKKYNLCGNECKQEFEKDPNKYAQIGESEK